MPRSKGGASQARRKPDKEKQNNKARVFPETPAKVNKRPTRRQGGTR